MSDDDAAGRPAAQLHRMSDDEGGNPGRKKGFVKFYPTVSRFVRLSRRFDD
jgi:hypothetical protein